MTQRSKAKVKNHRERKERKENKEKKRRKTSALGLGRTTERRSGGSKKDFWQNGPIKKTATPAHSTEGNQVVLGAIDKSRTATGQNRKKVNEKKNDRSIAVGGSGKGKKCSDTCFGAKRECLETRDRLPKKKKKKNPHREPKSFSKKKQQDKRRTGGWREDTNMTIAQGKWENKRKTTEGKTNF